MDWINRGWPCLLIRPLTNRRLKEVLRIRITYSYDIYSVTGQGTSGAVPVEEQPNKTPVR